MKISVLFEGTPKKPGAFYQNLNSAILLDQVKDQRFEIEFITIENDTFDFLKKKKFKVKKYKENIFSKIFNFLNNFNFFEKIVLMFNIKHPFEYFLKKNNFDLVIFLSPHNLCYYCGEINFVINIWDIDHKKNSIYSEHRKNYNYKKRENLINYALFHSFKTVVADFKTKKELINIYKGMPENIIVQPFIPLLPKLYDRKKNQDYKIIFEKFNLPKKKLILYPATFWEHKNHKYLLDVALILKQKKIEKYHFIFCGHDKGFLKHINNKIIKNNLENYITILNSVSDKALIALYKNVFAITMPTTGGPTNLPIYESFYFKKLIFYSDHLLDKNDKLNNLILKIDLDLPDDFASKLINFQVDTHKKKIIDANKYFFDVCSDENYKKNYLTIIDSFIKKKI